MPLFEIVETTSPTLTAGKFDVSFNSLDKVNHVLLKIDASLNSTTDLSLNYDTSISYSGNVASVYVFATMLEATPRKALCTTAQIVGKKVTAVGFKQS